MTANLAATSPEETDAEAVDVWQEVTTLAEDDEGGEDEMHVISVAKINVDLPLLILVHPGDAVERKSECGEKIFQNCRDFQAGMANSILARAGTHDLVVLHRVSSQYAIADGGDCLHFYSDVVDLINDFGTSLYGDGLDDVSTWIEENLKASKRPHVYLVGAFSEPKYGCLAHIGKCLLAFGANIEVDPNSPSEPGNVTDQWRPEPVTKTTEPETKSRRR